MPRLHPNGNRVFRTDGGPPFSRPCTYPLHTPQRHEPLWIRMDYVRPGWCVECRIIQGMRNRRACHRRHGWREQQIWPWEHLTGKKLHKIRADAIAFAPPGMHWCRWGLHYAPLERCHKAVRMLEYGLRGFPCDACNKWRVCTHARYRYKRLVAKVHALDQQRRELQEEIAMLRAERKAEEAMLRSIRRLLDEDARSPAVVVPRSLGDPLESFTRVAVMPVASRSGGARARARSYT